jgi:glycosyltransferase involved in cell wall biosynthesis
MWKVGLVRDNKMNPWAFPREECLADRLDMTLFVGERNEYDVSGIRIPHQMLTHREELLLAARSPRLAWERMRHAPFKRADYYFHSLRKHTEGFDIIHSTDLIRSAYTLADLKAERGYRLVLSWWQNIPYWSLFDARAAYYRDHVIPRTDAFVPYAEATARALIMEGIPKEKVHTVYPAVDLKRFCPGPRDPELVTRLGIPEDAFVLNYIGKLTATKGTYNIPYALKLLADDGLTNVHVVLAGRGAQRASLEKLVALWGMAGRFHFVDFLSYQEVHRVHSLADAFVMPSYPTMTSLEQFGFAVMEAMACGKPPVVSTTGGLPEAVGDAGLVFPAGDFGALARHVRRLIEDRPFREDLGAKARARAEACFDPHKTADALYAVYEKVMRG